MATAYGYALVCPCTEGFDDGLDRALEAIGLSRAAAPATGRLSLIRSSDRVALVFEWGEPALHTLPVALARATSCSVKLHALELSETDRGEPELLAAVFEASVVEPDGRTHAVDRDEELVERSGDLAETLGDVLWGWLRDEVDGAERLGRTEPLDVGRLDTDLPPRLSQLVRDVRAAGRWTVSSAGDRFAVRVELPDGSRRVSVLTAEELRCVEAGSGVPPSRAP